MPLNTVLKPLEEAERRGLITRDHERVVPTARGRRFLNDLLQIFLPDREANGEIRKKKGPGRVLLPRA